MAKAKWMVTAAALLGLACGAASAQTVKIGYLPSTVGQALTQAWKTGIENTIKGQQNVSFQALDAQMKAEIQVTMMDDFINQGYNAIILQPIDAAALTASVKKAEGKGIPVITLNTDTKLPHAAVVTMDDEGAGYMVGEKIGKALGGKGNVAILMGKLDNEGALKRTAGNEEVQKKKYPGIKILDKQTGQWQRNEGLAKTEDWLNRFGKDLNAILANNDDMALGAIQALKDKKRTDIIVVGVDATPDALTSVSKGELAATVFQDAAGQGGGGVEVAMKAAKGEKVAKETWIPFKLVTPANLSQFKK